MKENNDKNIEQFIARAMKETPLESPSHDFTSKVMTGVLALEKSTATVYKPLISKTGWLIIFGGIIATMVYLFVNGGAQSGRQARSFGPGMKNFMNSISDLHLFEFSRITIIVILLSAILMLAQITLLKNHLEKRIKN
jgi:hypothetical protein